MAAHQMLQADLLYMVSTLQQPGLDQLFGRVNVDLSNVE